MTNLEGRVLRRRALREPPAGVGTDLGVLAGLSARLGYGGRFDAEPRAVFEELRRASAGAPADYAGVTWERIDAQDGVFWPCPGEDHPGSPRLFSDSFPTPDGRARFVPVDHRPPVEEPGPGFPLYLTTGRVLAQYQSGTQTRRVASLAATAPAPFVELHPDVAALLSIVDGEPVRVVSRRGAAVLAARVVDTIRPDTLFAPFHWPGINALTNDALDPTSRMPEFKVCAARVEKLT